VLGCGRPPLPLEVPLSPLRLALIALLAAASMATAAQACNEDCTSGFVFSDSEGVCVKAAASV